MKLGALKVVAKNQRWAGKCPLLMFVLTRRKFREGGRNNRHAPFDAGAAWVSLALQARRMGLYAHAMAGFNLEKAYEVLGVSKRTVEAEWTAAKAWLRRELSGGAAC